MKRRNFIKNTISTAGLISFPNLILGNNKEVNFALGGWAVDSMQKIINELEFTKETGIKVNILKRPGDADFASKMLGAFQANTSPYDIFDDSDASTQFIGSGFIEPLDDLLPKNFWDDWPKEMMSMVNIWAKHKGETFRIHHNYEAQYTWYRKDIFEKKGISPPKTWDEQKEMGAIFTNENNGIWATSDGMLPNFFAVYLGYITNQAGGNKHDVGEEYATALQYIYDLMYKYKTLNPASLQKNYDQQNSDYTSNRIMYMRQWPFFYDVSRSNKDWFSEEKVEVALPPIGPGGKSMSTYAAGWGWVIPKTAPKKDAAKELMKWLVDKDNAAKMVDYSVWYLSSRKSVLKRAGSKGLAGYLKLYSDEGVISARPFHPKFNQAKNILEEEAGAFLTKQKSLKETLTDSKNRLEYM